MSDVSGLSAELRKAVKTLKQWNECACEAVLFTIAIPLNLIVWAACLAYAPLAACKLAAERIQKCKR